jgi:hypothetical protein
VRPDSEHDAVLACDEPHQVVVAPPGTGKTHLSVRLAGRLSDELAPHERVLLLTFSRQARAQLEREAARQLTRDQRARIEITNYHRFCWQAVSRYRRALGLPNELDIGSSKRRVAALRSVSDEAAVVVRSGKTIIDSLAEHAFPAFRDDRTPELPVLESMLDVVRTEHAAGRLVFDDLGALFWRLLEEQPTVAAAYAARHPIVIADEHQDASALQDAIVRRFGTRRLVVLADHLQLIHGYRGADLERLRAHWRESGAQHRLNTPHRWHGRAAEGAWLLSVRDALEPRATPARSGGVRPSGVDSRVYSAERGLNGALPFLKYTVPALLRDGAGRSVAVLVRQNDDLGRVRRFLSTNGLRPRQLGGPRDFEEAREDIEQLPLLTDSHSVALHARERLVALVPTIPTTVVQQLDRRLKPAGPQLAGAKEPATTLLRTFEPLWRDGSAAFFQVMSDALRACAAVGYHLPRPDATRALLRTAEALAPDANLADCIAAYSEEVAASMHAVPQRTDRGLFLMTAHQAKGKEFDAVVLFPLDARRWPDDDEHRRLLYVALTRATRDWVLIAPSHASSPLLRLLP